MQLGPDAQFGFVKSLDRYGDNTTFTLLQKVLLILLQITRYLKSIESVLEMFYSWKSFPQDC